MVGVLYVSGGLLPAKMARGEPTFDKPAIARR
jgi:hypothetical protein